MTREEFFQEIENASDEKKAFMDRIKSHGLPIIIFGAGHYAEEVTNILNSYGVKISGYAVDEQYYKPDKTYLGLPIYNFSELYLEPEKYVFIRGINKDSARKNTLIQNFKDIQTVLVTKAKNLTANYVLQNRDKFYETYTLLDDDLSKETMISYLKAAVADNLDHIQNIVEPHSYEYFNNITRNEIDKRGGGGGYLDCGAYIGGTIKKFIEFTNGNYDKIFAFEPDPENFKKLANLIEQKNYRNVFLYNCGVWDKETTLRFKNQGDMGSAVSEDGGINVPVNTIDNVVTDNPVNLIKMDIEGSELHALKGAINTLQNYNPMLIICVYHKAEDLITIPQFIKNIYKNARFYIRHYNTTHLLGLDLYVIPE